MRKKLNATVENAAGGNLQPYSRTAADEMGFGDAVFGGPDAELAEADYVAYCRRECQRCKDPYCAGADGQRCENL